MTCTDFGQAASTDSRMEEVIWSQRTSRSEGMLSGSNLLSRDSEYCLANFSSRWREEIIGLLLGIGIPENVSISTSYMVILGEMDLKVAKLVNLAKIWTCRPLIWSIIHQQVMLEGPESPKSPHKLVQPENVSISSFYMVIMGEMDPKVTKLVNLAQIWTCRPLLWSLIHQRVMLEGPESPKSPHKLVQPENVSISVFYMVLLGEMDPEVVKLVNFAQIWTCRPLIGPIIHQRVMVEAPELPKSPLPINSYNQEMYQ